MRDLGEIPPMRRITLLFALGSKILLGALLLCALALAPAAANGAASSEFSGMVWERHGDWHLNGSSTALRLGEAIPPGGLVTGSAENSAHSMTILLPDGQRMLCEC